ncbi:unnamed protein product [Arabis nemorensis]|uniref:Uncharacterized protein n=1 Tax=Arabis nemorensis TaxID=586526 RepID=A0A565CW45_9BRAS|nr:unnamed protein product [Arabis nemorensis]
MKRKAGVSDEATRDTNGPFAPEPTTVGHDVVSDPLDSDLSRLKGTSELARPPKDDKSAEPVAASLDEPSDMPGDEQEQHDTSSADIRPNAKLELADKSIDTDATAPSVELELAGNSIDPVASAPSMEAETATLENERLGELNDEYELAEFERELEEMVIPDNLVKLGQREKTSQTDADENQGQNKSAKERDI